MCDESDLKRWTGHADMRLSRRQFAAAGAAGAASLGLAPSAAKACYDKEITMYESPIRYSTADGTQDGVFFRPTDLNTFSFPAVIFWPDIAGIRPANRQMARRLAEQGYSVALLNPYYRDVQGDQFENFADFAKNDGFAKVKPWREKFSPDAIMRDAKAAADWLKSRVDVEPNTRIGAQGYCMTGSFAMYAAKAAPDQIGAVASFHGGGLVGADRGGPISAMDGTKSSFLIAVARNDDARQPEDVKALRAEAKRTGVTADIEVYPADHGWTVPDSPSYDPKQADRAFDALLAAYSRALASG